MMMVMVAAAEDDNHAIGDGEDACSDAHHEEPFDAEDVADEPFVGSKHEDVNCEGPLFVVIFAVGEAVVATIFSTG